MVPMIAFALASLILQSPADSYDKVEYMIPMRDGVKLYASVYIPKNMPGRHPIMLHRTCYSAGPYGPGKFRGFAGSKKFQDKGYIFAFEDVRGRFMSEGKFEDVRPLLRGKGGPKDIDEATDTYDTVDYLVKNVRDNNGKVGAWGISYPGFYTACAGVNSHPALKAISPQAPVTNWFIGDDFHHGGALFLQDGFGFLSGFEPPRPGPGPSYPPGLSPHFSDSYKFYLGLGALPNADKYFHHEIPFWNDMMAHSSYDDFWKARDSRPGLTGAKCAILTVGGMWDAEDMWGAMNTYRAFEDQNPGIDNKIVLGPWFHGGWSRSTGEKFGDIEFGQETSTYFREQVEFPFFDHYLNDGPDPSLPEALVFQTGSNEWKKFAQWPPKTTPKSVYIGSDGTLQMTAPDKNGVDEYLSDPAHPVPFTMEVRPDRNREYMIADQRFASRRPDVLTFSSPALDVDETLAGPIDAKLFASMTGSDADFIVKVIDQYPDDTPAANGVQMGGYQMLLRWEVLRGKFRDSWEHPSAFRPNKVTPVTVHLNSVLHTFKKGHRMVVQIQSSMFPLIDRNPQTFEDIYKASDADFKRQTIRIYHSPQYPSHLEVGELH